MDLFKLIGTIAIEGSEQANSQIDSTTEKASSFGQTLTSGIGTVAKWGTAIVGGATLAVGGLMKVATSSAEAGDHIDKMSQKIGISREAYQELDFICSQSGMSVDQLQAGMKSLTSAMDGAREGTASNVEQFEKLGVAVTNADGTFRSQEDVMWDTLSALQGVEDQTEKARLATELFGRSGTELMPLLNGEAGSIEEMKQQAHDLGLVLSDELIDNSVNLTDSLDQTKRAFQSMGIQIGGALMPIVEKASDYIQQAIPYISSVIERLSPILTGMLDRLLPPLLELGEQIFPVLFDLLEQILPPVVEIVEAILPVIVELVQMILPPLVQIVQMILPLLVSLIEPLLPLLEPILSLLQPFIDLLMMLLTPLIELLNMILPPLIAIISELVQGVIEGFLVPAITALVDLISGVLNVAFESIMPVIQNVMNVIVSVWNTIKDTVFSVVNAIGQGISTAFNNIKTVITTIMNAVWSYIQTIWNTIKTVISTVVTTIKTTITNGFNQAKQTVTNIFNSIKDTISNVMEGAKNVVSNAIEKIKGFFNFEWSLPKLKLPHFTISGSFSLNPPSVPSFGIEWYKKGGILTEPTLFDYNPATGQAKVGGEAGAEAVAPIDVLQGYVAEAVASQNYVLVEALQTLIDAIENLDNDLVKKMVEALEKMQFTINNREFARLVKAVN